MQWAVLSCSLSYSPDCRCLCPHLRWQSAPSRTVEGILTLCIEHACLEQFKGVAVFRLTFHMLHLEWLLGNEVLHWRWRVNPYNQVDRKGCLKMYTFKGSIHCKLLTEPVVNVTSWQQRSVFRCITAQVEGFI